MIGAIAGAAMSIGSSIYGGLNSAKASRKAKAAIEQEKAENTAYYNRAYNEDGTQRADALRLMRRTREAMNERNKQAAATQAVVGGTDESVAATRQANANAVAETASAINAQADARKDNIEQSYRQQDAAYNNQLNNIELQRSQNIANTASQAMAAAGKIASAVDAATEGSGNKSAKTTQPALNSQQKASLDAQAQKANNNMTLSAHQSLNSEMQDNLSKGFSQAKSIFDVARLAPSALS